MQTRNKEGEKEFAKEMGIFQRIHLTVDYNGDAMVPVLPLIKNHKCTRNACVRENS